MHADPGAGVKPLGEPPCVQVGIAALVDGTSTTLKRYVMEKGRAILRAANPRYADIKPDRLESQGVLVGLIGRGKR